MIEAVKFIGMNRISSDSERQQQVRNWLIKSRNHMSNLYPMSNTQGKLFRAIYLYITAIFSTAMSAQYHLPDNNRKFKLRRFHSHDTSSNIFSVADFENARLARRNEMEMKKRIQNTSKFNSLDSIETENYSTNESKTSKRSINKHVSNVEFKII